MERYVDTINPHPSHQMLTSCAVWHGTQEKYQRYDQIGGRFNSEFGLAAFPVVSTTESFVTRPEDLYPQSRVLDFHNKADGHERRIATYVAENFRVAQDLAVRQPYPGPNAYRGSWS